VIRILVIGCASLDTLRLSDGQTHYTIGGAGLYTALAAARVGAETILLAPKPQPLPEQFSLAANRLQWIGPLVSPDDLPRLEIQHHGGGRATLLAAAWGAEAQLTPAALDDDLSGYGVIHIAALSSASRQLGFLRACRKRGAPCVSAGTYAKIVRAEPGTVRALFAEANYFFMNKNEAANLFESWDEARPAPGNLLFITDGKYGLTIRSGRYEEHVIAEKASELDPTGAGDAFCGATLAALAGGDDPAGAADIGAQWAARVVESVGPAALLIDR